MFFLCGGKDTLHMDAIGIGEEVELIFFFQGFKDGDIIARYAIEHSTKGFHHSCIVVITGAGLVHFLKEIFSVYLPCFKTIKKCALLFK